MKGEGAILAALVTILSSCSIPVTCNCKSDLWTLEMHPPHTAKDSDVLPVIRHHHGNKRERRGLLLSGDKRPTTLASPKLLPSLLRIKWFVCLLFYVNGLSIVGLSLCS